MKKAIEDITKASHKLAEVIYQQHATAQAGSTAPAEEKPAQEEAEVVDAEFEDEK